MTFFKNPPSGGLIDTRAKAMEKSAPAIESNVRAINFANTAKIRILPSDAKVCCGDGIFWNEENFLFENIVYIPSGELSKKSDLIGIRAEGGSMEPKIHDGDLVVFRDDIGERESVSTGDIAILNYNGRVIIRGVRARGDKVTLCALNPDYKDIEVTPDDEFIILGKVAARLAFEEITGFL